MQTERSIPQLTKEVAFHLGDMIRSELKLARLEATDAVKSTSGAAGLVATGAVVITAALTVAFLAIAFALAMIIPLWAAMTGVAVVTLLIGFTLLAAGKAKLKQPDLSLPKTREQVSRDIQQLSERVH